MKNSQPSEYVPDIQDIVILNFDPALGQEIQKRRPALVLSHRGYSELTGLVVITPVTHAVHNQLKNNGLLVPVPKRLEKIDGFFNPLQFYTLDYRKRKLKFIETLDTATFLEVHRTIMNVLN